MRRRPVWCMVSLALAAGCVGMTGPAERAGATVDLLHGTGGFERPVITGTKTFPPGAVLNGWKVLQAKVGLEHNTPPQIAVAQGQQALSLVDPSVVSSASQPAGVACHPIAVVAQHTYHVAFDGAVAGPSGSSTVRFEIRIGSQLAATAPIANTGFPKMGWLPLHLTIVAPANSTTICATTTRVARQTYPLIDDLEVHP